MVCANVCINPLHASLASRLWLRRGQTWCTHILVEDHTCPPLHPHTLSTHSRYSISWVPALCPPLLSSTLPTLALSCLQVAGAMHWVHRSEHLRRAAHHLDAGRSRCLWHRLRQLHGESLKTRAKQSSGRDTGSQLHALQVKRNGV